MHRLRSVFERIRNSIFKIQLEKSELLRTQLLRWRIKLVEFEFTIIFKKGALNTNADSLSRIETHMKETSDIFDNMTEFNKNLDKNDDSFSTLANPDTQRVHN